MSDFETGAVASDTAREMPRRSRSSARRQGSEAPATLRRRAVIALAGVAALAVLLVAVDVVASAGRVHPGVRIGDVKVGGQKPAVAAERLIEAIEEKTAQPVSLSFEGRSWEVSAEDIGLSFDVDALVANAMDVGRTGPLGSRLSHRASAWFRPVEVELAGSTDESRTAQLLDEVAGEIELEPSDARVVIEGTDVTLEPASVGVALRRDVITEDLAKAFVAGPRSVSAAIDFTPVRVTDEDAAGAFEDTKTMLSGPAAVVYDSDRWTFEPSEIATWIAFRSVPASETPVAAAVTDTDTASATGSPEPGIEPESAPRNTERYVLEAYVDSDKAEAGIGPKVGSVGRTPVNARFTTSAGTVTIVPSQDGVEPDIEALALSLTQTLKQADGAREVELRTKRLEPEITTEKARGMGIKERIATYQTTFASSNKPRVNNIHVLADALDGTLIEPGGVFSFNETIGPRTAAKGYQEAPAIVGGRLVPQLGGGICQIGTTIFNAVYESGLPVVERRNHSFYISSYPTGRDATVSWGGPDFKFKNDTDAWILIATGYTNSSVTVSIYGTDPGYQVTSQVGSWTGITPHGVEEKRDPELPEGSRIVEDSGVDGRSIVVTRTVKKDGSVVRTDTFKSTYRPKTEIVRVGTKVVASESATGTASP